MSALLNTPLTMSSREIAELTGKRHDHVIRDIEKMLNGLELDGPNFGGVYIDAKGERRKCYNLNKELTYTLMAGYNVKLRNAIIKRWMELEEASQPVAMPKPADHAKIEGAFKFGLKVAQSLGLKPKQAVPYADQYCQQVSGQSPIALMGLDTIQEGSQRLSHRLSHHGACSDPWMEHIKGWLPSTGRVRMCDILSQAIGLTTEKQSVGARRRAGAIMHALAWSKLITKIDGKSVRFWVK